MNLNKRKYEIRETNEFKAKTKAKQSNYVNQK